MAAPSSHFNLQQTCLCCTSGVSFKLCLSVQQCMQAKVDRVRGINLRITRKRPLSALTWTLAPGLKIGVQVGHPLGT
jgi:hypothetical protein